MGIIDFILLGIGLAMDAFAVSICKGLGMTKINKNQLIIIASFFGGFQAIMPLIGYLLGNIFAKYVMQFSHWIAFVLLAFIGIKMIIDAIKERNEKDIAEEKDKPISFKEITLLAIATSIDALAVGVTFSFYEDINIVLAIVIIGVITLIISALGVFIGNIFGSRYRFIASLIGGIILVLLGIIAAIVSYGIWMTNYYTVYPIESLGIHVRRLTEAGDNQEELDAVVRQMRTIDIRTDDEIEKLYHDLCDMALNQTEKLRSIRRLSENTLQMQDGLIITMADLVENRDADTGAHIQKTAAYVDIIVRGLKEKGYYAEKITPKFMSDVVRSAPLHDVGKINIPDNVLNKPGKLTDEEYEIMKTHTTAGMKIMEKAIDTVGGENYLKEARNMAAYHHERWDGKGYPEGLHGEVIPLSARIMAVADVFDALTSPRVYKPPFPLEKALAIIEEGKGTQFDEKCVEVFMDSLDEVKVILRKYHNEYYKENDIEI